MLTFIQHRVNTIEALDAADPGGGVEIDLRSRVDAPNSLHLSHDPWTLGEPFDPWLARYVARGFSGPLVLNTKEDSLEQTIVDALEHHGIDHYFFLDTTAPTLVKCLQRGWGANMAVRLSHFETGESLRPWFDFQAPPGWIWADCFDGVPLDPCIVAPWAQRADICLVSPELQQAPLDSIGAFAALVPMARAVCTKHPRLWCS